MSDERITLEVTADNKEDALAKARFELGVDVGQLTITVLDEPDPETGRTGRYKAVMTEGADADDAEETPSLDAVREKATELLQGLIDQMEVPAEVTSTWGEVTDYDKQPVLLLNITGRDTRVLIGHKGETISALQYLTRLMVSRFTRASVDLVVDVDDYKARRAQQLEFLALRIAEQVVQSGRTMPLEPMPAHERRVVHMTLRENPDVITESEGEGSQRRVLIKPMEEGGGDEEEE